MSYLSEELERLMHEQQINGILLAKTSGISTSQIYKWTRGEQTHIDRKNLAAVSAALCKNNKTSQAKLVRAHLMDERFGPGHELVTIEIETPTTLKDAPRGRTKGDRAIEFLSQQRLIQVEVNDTLIAFANTLGAKI